MGLPMRKRRYRGGSSLGRAGRGISSVEGKDYYIEFDCRNIGTPDYSV